MKILVSCFEPFGSDSINSSKEIVENLNEEDIIITLLPVTLSKAFEKLEEKIKEEKPDFILLNGMAKGRLKVALEKQAINLLDFRIPDNEGVLLHNKKIIEKDIPSLSTKINLEYLKNSLGDDVYISNDAGAYICNYLYFLTLYHYKEIPSLFIHHPALSSDYKAEFGTNLMKKIIKILKESTK